MIQPMAMALVAAVQAAPVWIEAPVPDRLAAVETRAVEVSRDGSVWLAVRDSGLFRVRESGLDRFTASDGLASNGIADLLEDRSGRLWAVGVGGYALRDAGSWTAHASIGPLSPPVVFAAYEDATSGAIWLAANGGAGRLEGDGWSTLEPGDGLPHRVVHDVVVGADGTAWLACRTGLARVGDGGIDVLFPDTNIRSALAGPDGVLWFGTSDGVLALDGVEWRRFLEGRTIYPRLVSADGAIWAGSAGSGVYRFDGSDWVPVELPERVEGAEVFDLAEAPDGSVWIATARGVVRVIRESQVLDAGRIDAWFRRLVEEQGFSGVVLIAQHGRILLSEGYGRADDERGTAMTPSTVVLTGSISKQFTAAAILRLESDGLLRVTDPITGYLPEVPADKRTITIHHLLTHTAGFTSDHFDHDFAPISLEEALQAIWALPLGFEPGTRYDYSNTGYALLAAIVQEVSGRPFTSYMREEMFEPAGLTATGFFGDDWTGHHVATAYRNGERQGRPSEFPGPFWGNMGNGGVMSTTMDLFRWFHGLESGEILGAEGGRKMFAPHAPTSRDGQFYGYGWAIGETDFGPAIMHSGLGLGGNSDLAFYREPELTIIILSNRAAFRFRNGEPYELWTPAVEARRQLVLNLKADDFGTLPTPTLVPSRSRVPIVLVGLGLLGATLFGAFVHRLVGGSRRGAEGGREHLEQ